MYSVFAHFHITIHWVHADVVGAPHRIYHDALGAISDDEADARDTIIGHIPNLPSICKPQPPREALATLEPSAASAAPSAAGAAAGAAAFDEPG